eukprot:gene10908-22770_t
MNGVISEGDRDTPPVGGSETDEDRNVCESCDTFRLQVIDTGAGISQVRLIDFNNISIVNEGSVSDSAAAASLGNYSRKESPNLEPYDDEKESTEIPSLKKGLSFDLIIESHTNRLDNGKEVLINNRVRVLAPATLKKVASSKSSSWRISSTSSAANKPPLMLRAKSSMGLFSTIPSARIAGNDLDDGNRNHNRVSSSID